MTSFNIVTKRMAITMPAKLVKNRPPLLSNTEFAEEIGTTKAALGKIMGKSKVKPPEPQLRSGSTSAGTQRHYNAKELRAWWAAHQTLKKEEP